MTTRPIVSSRKWWTRPLLYAALILFALFFLMPIYVLLITALKPFTEVDLKTMWALPHSIALDNFVEAYSKLAPNLGNSMRIVLPAALLSSMLGSINGYVFSKFKFPYSNLIFT